MERFGMISGILAASVAGSFAPRQSSICNALSIGSYFDDMADVDMGDVELLNDLADVGALPRFRRAPVRRQAAPRRMLASPSMPARRLIPQVPGAPAVGLRLQPLGFPVRTFNAASGTALTTNTRPQRPFKGKRLSISIARTGATATGLVTVTTLAVGTNNQMVSLDPISAESFSPLATDSNVELAATTTAIDLTIGFAITVAPGAADRVDLGTTLFGESVG